MTVDLLERQTVTALTFTSSMSYKRRELTENQKKLLGQNLKAARKRAKLETAAVNDALELANTQLSLWETGTRAPEMYALLRFAVLYKCSLDTLVVGVEPDYSRMILKRLPPPTQHVVRALVDATLLRITDAFDGPSPMQAMPPPTGEESIAEAATGVRKSAATRGNRKRKPPK